MGGVTGALCIRKGQVRHIPTAAPWRRSPLFKLHPLSRVAHKPPAGGATAVTGGEFAVTRRVLPEYEKTEKPLIEQLTGLGWEHLEGAPPGTPVTDPGASGRASFTDVVYAERFRTAVRRINPGPDGTPWLKPFQLDYLYALVRGTAPGQGPAERGVAGNIAVTKLLRHGINARMLPGWKQGDPQHVQLVDWTGEFERGEGNDYLAVSQFRVERPGAGPVTPDLVLFLNGLPWAVIECKAPLTSGSDSRAALDDAVEQVVRYAGVEAAAPVAEFVRFAQILVGTDRDHAELGTVTSDPEYFTPWRMTVPTAVDGPETDLAVLTTGVLDPVHLLTLVRDFTTESGRGSRTLKVIGRYQQYRAVRELARRLRARKDRIERGHDTDQRGGVVWHTQGSGKSLTMAFLVRYLRSDPELRGHKVVVVTDRIDLEKQIRGSLAAAEETIHRAPDVDGARAHLELDVPDVVLVMLQKAQRDDSADDGRDESLGGGEDPAQTEAHVHVTVANPSPDVVVLVDEAHRGQDRWLHARLRAMLPNASLIGFTGTPIISGARKKTEEIFGTFADTYTLRDAEADGSVVPVRYEGYSVPLEVVEKAALDAKFDERVPDDPKQRARVLRKFARRKEILEAPSVIEAKADHMLRHWATTALPDRFGAQVVAVSRLAAVRYREELLAARNRLLARLDALDPALVHDPMAAVDADNDVRELLTVLPHRSVLASIDAAVVISKRDSARRGSDPESWRDWTLKSKQDAYIERFKKGLGDPLAAAVDPSWPAATHGASGQGLGGTSGTEVWHTGGLDQSLTEASDAQDDDDSSDTMAFLVVQSMLLTGFDAPVEQILYLDCALSGVGLLQAVARTNRPYPKKQWGLVVDYIGIGPELARSLREYDQEHLRQVYGFQRVTADHLDPDYDGGQPTRDGLLLQADAAADGLLADLHRGISAFVDGQGLASYDARGILSLADEGRREDLLAALWDPLARGEFDELVRDFLTALGAVLPRPNALDYENLARQLGEVQYLARQRYLDGRDQFSPRRYGAKVRQLISEHLKVTDVEQRVPPVELSAPDFMTRVDANPDARARTSYMVSRLRTRITAEIGTDRARYESFSKRLDEIVQRMRQDFEQAATDLARLVGDVNAAGDQGEEYAVRLDPLTEGPVYRLLLRELEKAGVAIGEEGTDLYEAASALSADIAVLVRPPSFVTLPSTRNEVRKELRKQATMRLGLEWEDTADIAAYLLELAVTRRDDFLNYGRRESG